MKKVIRDVLIFWAVLLVGSFLIATFCQAEESKPASPARLADASSKRASHPASPAAHRGGQGGLDFSIKGVYTIYQDKDLLENGKGLKGELRYDWFYLWISSESTELRLTGQRAGGIDLFGVGPGIKVKLIDGLSVFMEGGYYVPKADLAKDTQKYSEGVSFKWYQTLDEIGLSSYASKFTTYKYDLKSGIGGSVGLSFQKEIWNDVYVSIMGGYRFLNLKEDWKAYHHTIPGCYIETKEKRSFSGGVLGVGITYQF